MGHLIAASGTLERQSVVRRLGESRIVWQYSVAEAVKGSRARDKESGCTRMSRLEDLER